MVSGSDHTVGPSRSGASQMSKAPIGLDELFALLGAPKHSDATTTQKTSSAGISACTDTQIGAYSADPVLKSVHHMLARALPRLWRFALTQSQARGRRKLRSKLRELLGWVLTKNGFAIQHNVKTPFRHLTENIQGRLELLVSDQEARAMLAVETDWFAEEQSLLKLQFWHRKGVPVLWIIGSPCRADHAYRLRALANRTLHQSTAQWLPIFHLEHGWVWSGSHKSHE